MDIPKIARNTFSLYSVTQLTLGKTAGFYQTLLGLRTTDKDHT